MEMVLPHDVVAVPTLDILESESGAITNDIPHLDIGLDIDEYPSEVIVDEFDNKIYVGKLRSDSVSVIIGDTLNVSSANIGHSPYRIAVSSLAT